MTSVDTELVLVALSAMLLPTTLFLSVLSLVVSDKPLRTGLLFYLGALIANLAMGVAAAFVLGNVAASPNPSTPKTWVAVIDVIAGVLLAIVAVRLLRRPRDPKRVAGMIERMNKVANSSAVAILGAGAALANAGPVVPLALKAVSETNPTAAQYVARWVAFCLVALAPLAAGLVALAIAREPTQRVLSRARGWLERNARNVAAGVLMLLAVALLHDGIAGLTA